MSVGDRDTAGERILVGARKVGLCVTARCGERCERAYQHQLHCMISFLLCCWLVVLFLLNISERLRPQQMSFTSWGCCALCRVLLSVLLFCWFCFLLSLCLCLV